MSSTATLAVTKTADTDDGSCDADCSLREAIAAANAAPGSTITFGATGTFSLPLGELVISAPMTIVGPGVGDVTVRAAGQTRVLAPIDFVVSSTTAGAAGTRSTSPGGGAAERASCSAATTRSVIPPTTFVSW